MHLLPQRNSPRGNNRRRKPSSRFENFAPQKALFGVLPAFDTVIEPDVQDEVVPEAADSGPVDPIVPVVLYNSQLFNAVIEPDVEDEVAAAPTANIPIGPEIPSKVAYSSDGEGDADEEDNFVEISRELENARLENENQMQEEGSSHITSEVGQADDEDGSFELSEDEYVFIDGSRQSATGGSWNPLRSWNGIVRRGSKRPSFSL